MPRRGGVCSKGVSISLVILSLFCADRFLKYELKDLAGFCITIHVRVYRISMRNSNRTNRPIEKMQAVNAYIAEHLLATVFVS